MIIFKIVFTIFMLMFYQVMMDITTALINNNLAWKQFNSSQQDFVIFQLWQSVENMLPYLLILCILFLFIKEIRWLWQKIKTLLRRNK